MSLLQQCSKTHVQQVQKSKGHVFWDFDYWFYFDYLCLFQTFKASNFSYDKKKIDAFLNSPTISITECLELQNGRRSVEGPVTQVTLSAKKKRDGTIVHSCIGMSTENVICSVQIYGDQQMENFQEGNCLIIRMVMIYTEPDVTVITMNKNTKGCYIFLTDGISIYEE